MNADGNRDETEGRSQGPSGAAVQASLRLFNHDIRAAVSDVIGGLRLIDRDRLNADMQEQFERVQIAGETLAELVDAAILSVDGDAHDDVFDHSFDFRSFLAGLEMRWSGRAREQGLAFRLDVDRRVPERVCVARLKLDRILGNLIANALKFTDQGQVMLSVDRSGDGLRFCVTDQGQGFSDTALERLFTPDGRPQDATRPGTGLGLHISKDLADSLGADLSVASAPGQGASVTLILPRDRWESAEPLRELPDLTGLSVLVAEDNVTNQILVRQLLERMGAEMELARDGAEAFQALSTRRFDLALLDIEMPRMTGIEVMRKLREQGDIDTPLVALTAYILRDNREAIYAAGADGVIAKPIRSVAGFGDAIRRHVDRSTMTTDAASIADEDGSQMIGEMDRNRFEALLQAAGPEGRVEFLTHLLQDLQSVSRILARAVTGLDAAEVRAQTHILISLAGAVGADRLQDLAESLNATAHRGRLAEAPALAPTCLHALGVLIDRVEKRSRREV
jgi:two-component system, OmpR family, aerobic respiration control sensor histidine kinase ArcB